MDLGAPLQILVGILVGVGIGLVVVWFLKA